MQWLRRLFGGHSEPPVMLFHVRCNRCGAVVQTRINLYNDLSVEYDDREEIAGYWIRKEMMDDRCFRLMTAELRFDRQRRLISQEVVGGQMITAEEYAAARQTQNERASNP
ncbi:MAG: hypothetical protein J7456_11745 [Chloroflexus sp.]|jgi:DNA-directed RNA polymerase subunit N (RpoN/RPB10)|uniref:hypothetical protein n=1 Tax=unclassified Chloroflexus TaxID=2633855 RepID=UPI0004DF2CA0|nr:MULTISPECIES: hypothetical protein [unclassified Chloroflexus]MBO9316442.1 hypothetical protein [Chloroflexus sp.]MBO9349264.1 hypothetical protein [Chloroflexus sp.]MDN5273385.1 hypothetical protein [Chloroflexus sp. MS-CIW-1]